MELSLLFTSIKIAFVATFFTLILGVLGAYMVMKQKKYRGVIDTIFTLPIVLPPTVVGFFLLLIFGKNGYIGKFLNLFDVSLVFSVSGAIIAAVVVSFPLMYRTTRSAFAQIDKDVISVARTLGLSEWTIFFKIIIPTSYSGIFAGAILSFARALGEFGATMMFAGNIPGKTQTISIKIYTAVQAGNYPMAFQWVGVILLISFVSIGALNFFETKQSFHSKNKGGSL